MTVLNGQLVRKMIVMKFGKYIIEDRCFYYKDQF